MNNKRPLSINGGSNIPFGYKAIKNINGDVHSNKLQGYTASSSKPIFNKQMINYSSNFQPLPQNINLLNTNKTSSSKLTFTKVPNLSNSSSNKSDSTNSNNSSNSSTHSSSSNNINLIVPFKKTNEKEKENEIDNEIEINFDDIEIGSPYGGGYPTASQSYSHSFENKGKTYVGEEFDEINIDEEINNNINSHKNSQVHDLKHKLDNNKLATIPKAVFKENKFNKNNRYKKVNNYNNNKPIDKDKPKVKLIQPNLSTITTKIEDIICKVYQLPKCIADIYSQRGIEAVYEWQRELLCRKNVLDGENFVYSLPTSAGKTFVSEVCLLKNMIIDQKKSMFIFPFISIVTEKARSIRDFTDKLNFHTDSYYSSEGQIPVPYGPRMMICTIEKANIVINQMLEDNRLHEIGCVVIDEIHMIGDNDRGVLLELLISKLIYTSNSNIQIIGMSATVPNIIHLAQWFRGIEYQCNYRPVPLTEYYKFGKNVYNTSKEIVKTLKENDDYSQIVELCCEVIPEHSVLVFCHSKQLCVDTAFAISKKLSKEVKDRNLSDKNDMIMIMEGAIGGSLNTRDKEMINAGVYYHNSNLTNDEREVIENYFKNHTILVLCATSTLSAGVNLPARRVILKSPKMGNLLLSPRNYKQMCGRAGRAGIDDFGESFLITDKNNLLHTEKLVSAPVEKLVSLIDHLNQWERITLESISTTIATTVSEIIQFIGYTFYATNVTIPKESSHTSVFDYFKSKIEIAIESLSKRRYIEINIAVGTPIAQESKILSNKELIPYKATKIGLSSFKSTLSINENDKIFTELSDFLKKPVFINEPLHICYLCTPLVGIPTSIDWEKLYGLFISLSEMKKSVAGIIGISAEHIMNRVSFGGFDPKIDVSYIRFYYAMALCELIQEVPLFTVANKYSIDRGSLQSIMQNASGYTYTLGLFCQTLGWSELNSLISLYIKRLDHGVKEDLLPILEIPGLKRPRARSLFNSGFKTIKSIAVATPEEISKCLKYCNSVDEAKRIINSAARVLEKKSEEYRVKVGEYLTNKPNENNIKE